MISLTLSLNRHSQGDEVAGAHLEDLHGRDSPDRRRPRSVAEQRQLSKVIARALTVDHLLGAAGRRETSAVPT
jgi:hypothetical protein